MGYANLDYNLDNAEVARVMNWKIAQDVLKHLGQIIDECSLHKLDKRGVGKQAAYDVAKLFGHRSSNPDLYLSHPSLSRDTMFVGSAECIRALDVAGVRLCYRVWLLGKQSKNASNKLDKSADPNEVCIYISTVRGYKQVNVTMDLSGPAMLQLCADLGRLPLARKFRAMLKTKWGGDGARFGNVDVNERKAQALALNSDDRRVLGDVSDHGEAYLYRRYLNGVPHSWDEGKGWMV